jgi:thymidylate synthase (FAD)
MRQVAIPLLLLFKRELSVLFTDIEFDKKFPSEQYAEVVWTDGLLKPLGQGI